MKKFIHINRNQIVDEVILINDIDIIHKRLFVESASVLLNRLHISDRSTINKRFRFKDCKGKVLDTWSVTIGSRGYENMKDFYKRLKELNYQEVK